jgi:hypothetical protein
MTAPIEYGRTDAPARMPRWLALVLFSAATLVAIGALWSLTPGTLGCGEYLPLGDGILPGPQPCPVVDGTAPALVTAGILLALLAAIFVVSFTAERLRTRIVLILGGAMLLVLIVGLLATVTLANTPPPVIYY